MNKYDVIGDVHGCYAELQQLLHELGYVVNDGVITHSDKRVLVFLGDLTDRGPASIPVLKQVSEWILNGQVLYCPGNHCDKLYRYFLGRDVTIKHGLETTVHEFKQLSKKEQKSVSDQFKVVYEQAPLYLSLDNGKLIVAHAGIRPDMIGSTSKQVKTFVLYGDITGETLPDGRPVRRDWASRYSFKPYIVYGHTPVKEPRKIGNTVNIDTGCVFGGSITALRWPECSTHSITSKQPYLAEKFQSFD